MSMPINVQSSETHEVPTQAEFEAELHSIAQADVVLTEQLKALRIHVHKLEMDLQLLQSRHLEHIDDVNEEIELLHRLVKDHQPTPEPEPEPEPEPQPEPPPPPPPPTPNPSKRLTVADFQLVGGIRLKQDFSGGGLAIDFEKGLIYQGGHDQRDDVIVHKLPAIGLGEPGPNCANWPIAERAGPLPTRFWVNQQWDGFANLPDHRLGLCVRDGKLWVSPRVFYDSAGTNRGMTLCSSDGDRISVPLDRAGFGGGFIEGHPEWLIGCGGYRSGSGSVAGPTVARISGEKLLEQVSFGNMDFTKRTPRPSGSWPTSGKDAWYAFIPRLNGVPVSREDALNGVGVGAWNADEIHDGGVWTERGLCFWAMMGFGELDYKLQSQCFAKSGMCRPYLYTYDPQTFARDSVQFEEWPWGEIIGCEVGPDGKIYLMRRRACKVSGMYVEDCAIYVFELKE